MVSLTIAIIALVASGAAVVISTWQAMLLRRQLQAQISVSEAQFHQNTALQFADLDKIFLEKPQLRPFFYDGETPQSPEHLQQTLALAEYITDMAECCTASEDIVPHLTGDWDDYFHYLYANSPVLRQYWNDFGHLYPARVVRAFVGESGRPKKWPTPVTSPPVSPHSPSPT